MTPPPVYVMPPGPHPAVPNVHDLAAERDRLTAENARLWGLLRSRGLTDDQIHVRVTPPKEPQP